MNWISKKLCELQSAFFGNECLKNETRVEDYSTFKVVELRAMAKDRGLKGYTGLRKAELVELLKQN